MTVFALMDKKKILNKMYRLLEGHFGDLGWWPARTDFEVVAGAVLTQNTAWRNVETAIKALKRAGVLDASGILRTRKDRLSSMIRSSGYHRVKADRLKAVSRYLIDECGGDLRRLKRRKAGDIRKGLLEVNGIGPETADSILLYAFKKPVFVVDAYTRRIFSRHALVDENIPYDVLQDFVHKNFPMSVGALNQLHALIVETAKRFCLKKHANCDECPLGQLPGIKVREEKKRYE